MKTFYIHIVFYVAFCLIVTSCNSPRSRHVAQSMQHYYPGNGPLTVFIHGTFFPGINLALRAFDLPLGFVPAQQIGNKLLHGRIAYACAEADPQQFPLASFYFFGWSGKLSFSARRKAATELYHILKKYQHRPITVIGHSHGGNVALNLAASAEQYDDLSFKVDKLILLATPVLEASRKYITSPVFKKVYAFYSTGDKTQTRDPQGLYTEMRRMLPGLPPPPFFSGRTFSTPRHATSSSEQIPNLIERRILYKRRNLEHLDFICMPFMQRLPDIVKVLKQWPCLPSNTDKQYIINIPKDRCKPIEQLVKETNCCRSSNE